MSRLRFEIQITLLTVIIAAAVVTTGYLGYNSLSRIVDSIHQASLPDSKLFLIKDISSDLSEIENSVRLYVLTDENQNRNQYEILQNSVRDKLQYLISQKIVGDSKISLIDSIVTLSYEKLEIWEGILNLYESTQNATPVFSEFYSKLEEERIDTIKTEIEKKGILRKIFGSKKVEYDTAIVVREIKKDEIIQDLINLESEIKQKGEQFNIFESRLIEKNLSVTENLNALIIRIERNESEELLIKTNDANRLSITTYKWMAAFSITAVALLLLVLFLLFSYMRKSRKYEIALKAAKNEAEAYARAKEQFAANVSHELRTPVNAIYGMSEQLLQKDFKNPEKEQLIVLSKSATHLKNIINDTLDFSKIQSNKLELNKVHFSPSEVFHEIVAIQKSQAINKGLELKYEVEDLLADAILGDPLRLKQIVLNLINNSLKFTKSGYVLLRVKTEHKKKDEYLLTVLVEDSGIGITNEDQENIFDEYIQAKSNINYGGTGLGLAIVKKLVDLHSGKIRVESELNKGTKIFVELPYHKGNHDLIVPDEPIKLDIPHEFKNLSVLIADDEEFNRFLIKGIFNRWGIAYHEVTNGIDAVKTSLQNNFDLIFMDLMMPGKNGIEASKEILDEKPDLKIIAITASNNDADKELSYEAGIQAFLSKPFSEVELFNLIVELLKINTESQTDQLEIEITKEEPKIDFDTLRHFANNDEEFMCEMLRIFIRSSETGIASIEEAFASNNFEQIAEVAHKLAAPSKHIKTIRLHELLIQIGDKVKSGNTNSIDVKIINELKAEIDSINTSIKNYLKNPEEGQIK